MIKGLGNLSTPNRSVRLRHFSVDRTKSRLQCSAVQVMADRPQAVVAVWTRRGGRTPALAPPVRLGRASSMPRRHQLTPPSFPSSSPCKPRRAEGDAIATAATPSSHLVVVASPLDSNHPKLHHSLCLLVHLAVVPVSQG